MSKYTTGEIAKLCDVSVRTVQYYDSRNLLVPSALSEGGRRLYSDDDVKRLRVICFLRDLGISINDIAALFSDKNPRAVIETLLEQQEAFFKNEASEAARRLEAIEDARRQIDALEAFSVESIGDVAKIMKRKNKLSRLRFFTVLSAIPLGALQWSSIILWITNGIWWLFPIWLTLSIPYAIVVSKSYFKRVAYICPECHEEFTPKLKEAFFAYHTPRMRKLSCKRCGRRCKDLY